MEINEFDPVLFSAAENAFLLDHLGEPPVIASRALTPGVNPKAVMPIVTKVYELEQLKTHEGLDWVGVGVIKQAIKTFTAVNAKWSMDHKRSRRAPRWPGLYSFDGKGRAHLGGPGSDSGRVRTYFDDKGNRVPFAVSLVSDDRPDWLPPGFTEAPDVTSGLSVNAELNRIECKICGHTESYKPEARASYNAARARMSKHLRKATEKVEDHREVYTNEFGS